MCLRAELDARGKAMSHIADIAHCGGWLGMSEGDALTAIRKLTIEHWNKAGSRSDHVQRVAEAMRASINSFLAGGG